MKIRALFTVAIALTLPNPLCAADTRLSATIDERDLRRPCPEVLYQIQLEGETDEQVGTAIMKLFYLENPGYIRSAVVNETDPAAWGIELATSFVQYCEQRPVVTASTAVKLTIVFLENR